MVFFGDFVLFTLWTLTLHVTTGAWTSDDGQPRVIGSSLPVVAALGDDTILPCRLEPSIDAEALTVEWSKPDLKPDPSDPLSRVEYVHLYRGRHEVTDMKIQSYVSRTELFRDELKHGNISLKIRNVTLADEGRYKCFIPKLNDKMFSIVHLVVEPNFVKMTATPMRPINLQTPDLKNETTIKGGRSHLVLLVPLLMVCLILSGGHSLKTRRESDRLIIGSDSCPSSV